MNKNTKVNLVLVGRTGTGKSACGNTILGQKHFPSKASSKPVTTECQVAERKCEYELLHVIDTPDIFDEDIKSSVRAKHVKKCKDLCQSGPHVFVLVLQIGRFTDGERDILRKLEKAFGSDVTEKTVVLFTRGDDLHRAGMSLTDFFESCQPDLKEIVENCGNRCVVFENKSSSSDQVENLMMMVNKMVAEENYRAPLKSSDDTMKSCLCLNVKMKWHGP